MSFSSPPAAASSQIDIESIVRRVLRELQVAQRQSIHEESATSQNAHAYSLDQRVITLEDLKAVPPGVKQIRVPGDAVVTPSVKDELRRGSVELLRGDAQNPHPDQPNSATDRTTRQASRSPYRRVHLLHDETVDAGLYAAVGKQVVSRGVRLCDQAGVTAMLSAHPATSVYRSIAANTSAVLINRLDDVVRFKNELRPSVYVLDAHHLHLIAMVNAVVQIARRSEQASFVGPTVTVAGGQR